MADDALALKPQGNVEDALRLEIGPIGRALARRYFEQVRFPQSAEDELRQMHARGEVVHVMRTTAWVNYLYLSWALVRRGLPPIRAVVNLRRWFTRPWRHAALTGDIAARFERSAAQQGAGLVFLKETTFGNAEGQHTSDDPFPALVERARTAKAPLFLVPELFVWEKWNQKVAPSLFDRIFGSPEAPGFLHSVMAFFRNYKRAQFRLGEPIELTAFVAENADQPTALLARKVRTALSVHLSRESRAVFGPPAKPVRRLLDEAMRDRGLRRVIDEVAAEKSRPVPQVAREARRNLDAIAARYSPSVVAVIAPVLHWVFNRIYDGVEVDEAGLERALKAAARGPVVLTPSHKSHVDYLIMSYVLWQRGYSVPLVAAGANLSFFPLGPVLRRGGAFFLRRSFKGDKVYTASFKAYLKKLVHDGLHHEFFPEGGRSRTGKLLQPKLGLFTWLADAVFEGARDDLTFIPVAIDYEKVVESASYSAELKGGEKKSEDVKALLSAPAVLTENYGRIHLSFDAPLSLAQLMRERGLVPGKEPAEEHKKGLVRALANRVMYGISQVSRVTPHALLASALLAHRRRGVSAREVTDRIVFLRRMASDLKAPFSRYLHEAPSSPTVLGPIAEAMRMFASSGFVRSQEARGETIYQLEDERRSELSFYKNTLINLVAGRTIVASALLASRPDLSKARVREKALVLSRLFKLEFIYPAGKSFEAIFEETVTHLAALGLIVDRGQQLELAPEAFALPTLTFLADLLRDYLESYRLAAVTLAEIDREGSLDKKEFLKRALELGRAEFLAGLVTCAEALSRTTLENALQYLLEQQYLIEADKKLKRGPNPDQQLAATVAGYLATS